MQLQEEALFTLKMDGKPVINELGELEKKLVDLKTAQKDVERGTKEWADNKTEIKALEASIKQVREEMGVSGMSVKQLEGYYRQLNREIKDLTPGTEEYKRAAGDLKEVNTALANHRANVRGVSDDVAKSKSAFEQFKDYVKAAFTVTAILEFGRQIGQFVGDSIREFKEFQTAAQQLSAITGLTGKDLDYLKQAAKDVGPAMGMSASEMLKAYQVMGSAKPELLANKEALAAITKEAIILSQASQMELPAAAKVVAESLNQYGKSADQAGRFINVMAAGAKEGAAEISEVSSSLKAAGTVAASAKVSFEQTNAVLQSLSTIALKGEQAGTMLRNVLLKMSSGAKEFNPEVVGLDKALENLGKRNMSTAELTKLFGTENVVAAKHIIGHRNEIGDLTKKLTGTQEAYSQAAKNTATLDFQTKQATATLALLKTEIGERLEPLMVKVVAGFVSFVNIVRAVPEFVRENKTELTALGVAMLAFNGHLILATANSIRLAAAEKIRTISTTAVTTAQAFLNATMTANPIGLVIAAVAVLVAGFTALYNRSETLRAGINGIWQAMKTAATVAAQFVKAFLSMDIAGMATAMLNGGKQIGDAFNKGYADKLESERPKQQAAHKAHLDKQAGDAKKAATDTVAFDVNAHGGGLDKKAAAAAKHRATEAKKAHDAAEKEKEAQIKANNDALDKIEAARIAAIQDDLQRSIAHIRSKRDSEIEAMMASKASSEVKAVFEKALNEKMIQDIAKATETHREKQEKEDAATAKRVFDLRVKISQDERADKLAKLEEVAARQRADVAELIKDDREKAALLKQINDTLFADKNKVEDEFRAKKKREDTALLEAQFAQTKADTDARLLMAGNNADKIYAAKKERLDAEYTYNRAKMQREAEEDKAKNEQLIKNTDKRAKADKAIDDKLKADLTAGDKKYENDKTKLSEEKTAARLKNQQEFFSAVRGLMQGDFTAFTDILGKKLSGEKSNLSQRQQATAKNINTGLDYAKMGLEVLAKLNEAALKKQLANIKKDRDIQLASWKDKFDKGLINKETFEKGVDKINTEAQQKEKEAKLKAFRNQQKLDIAMAVINGAQAAIKSLAMFGWPIGLIGVAGAVIATGIQIALIKRQEPPAMAKGGYIRNGGVPDGPGHGSQYGQSGIALVRRDTNEEVGEMEGNEPIMVLSRNTYKNNQGTVDALLDSSLHRNGAPIYRAGGWVGSDGGSYGTYLNRGGVLPRYDDGGMVADSGGGGGGDGGGGNQETLAETQTVADYTEAEIDKSQKLMEEIGKNTLATADEIKALHLTLQRQHGEQLTMLSSTAQNAHANARAIREQLQSMTAGLSQQLGTLRVELAARLATLNNTVQQQNKNLGIDLKNELKALNATVISEMSNTRTWNYFGTMSLADTTRAGFSSLQATTHADLINMTQTLSLRLAGLEMALEADLATLQRVLDQDLRAVKNTLQTTATAAEKADTLRANALRDELRTQVTALRETLKGQLITLQRAGSADAGGIMGTTADELRKVQNALWSIRGEQGTHSWRLGQIADKNLSVSVQSFAFVNNQINVVIDKSTFK